MIDKHIEAAAAAMYGGPLENAPSGIAAALTRQAQAAITAYLESLASEGEDGVVDAIAQTLFERDHNLPWAGVHASVRGRYVISARAALAVARANMGEVERDAARLDWIVDDSKCYWVEVQSQPSGDYVYRGGGYGLRDALDEVMSAARAKEAGRGG